MEAGHWGETQASLCVCGGGQREDQAYIAESTFEAQLLGSSLNSFSRAASIVSDSFPKGFNGYFFVTNSLRRFSVSSLRVTVILPISTYDGRVVIHIYWFRYKKLASGWVKF